MYILLLLKDFFFQFRDYDDRITGLLPSTPTELCKYLYGRKYNTRKPSLQHVNWTLMGFVQRVEVTTTWQLPTYTYNIVNTGRT